MQDCGYGFPRIPALGIPLNRKVEAHHRLARLLFIKMVKSAYGGVMAST
jgi:hypothetical protein